jgi:phage shock protein C
MAKEIISEKKLYRSKKDKVIFGVCGGLAEYIGIDSTLVRIVALLLLFSGTWFIIFYLILGAIIPENPKDVANKPKDLKDKYLVLGAGLIIFGVFTLLDNYNIINWGQVWPITLIVLGGYLLWKDIKKK